MKRPISFVEKTETPLLYHYLEISPNAVVGLIADPTMKPVN
jgi:hypothetical protein